MLEGLQKRVSGGGGVLGSDQTCFDLILPEMRKGKYGLAQLDDYLHLPRRQFPHLAPVNFQLEAKVSNADLPGTWGFGFWNDPFSFGFGAGGMNKLLPVLPNTAWFFYGSGENYLSLRDDVPANGFHVKTFRSPLLPAALSPLAAPAVPFLFWPPAARLIRRLLRGLVREESQTLTCDVRVWHHYGMIWETDQVTFEMDHKEIFTTRISPRGRLGLVIWIDNQYFRVSPDGEIGFGFLPTDQNECLSIRNLQLAVRCASEKTITKS